MSKRGQIAPLIRLVEWVLVVRGITVVHLGGAVSSKQRFEGGVDQRSVSSAQSRTSSLFQEICVYGCAQTYAHHAIMMPRMFGPWLLG